MLLVTVNILNGVTVDQAVIVQLDARVNDSDVNSAGAGKHMKFSAWCSEDLTKEPIHTVTHMHSTHPTYTAWHILTCI